MQFKKVSFLTVTLFYLWFPGIYAQEAISSAGYDASGNGGSMSFSCGQTVFTTNTGTSGSLAQGVQQPYEISVVTEIIDGPEVGLFITTYPNPTSHSLTLRFGGKLEMEYLATIYDGSGKRCIERTIVNNETHFDLSNLSTGTYFLKLKHSNLEVKTFKIVKN